MIRVLFAILLVSGLNAQNFSEPPNILRLIRMDPATVVSGIRAYQSARLGVNVVGLAAVSGLSESWLIECHDSFAGLEELDQSLANSPAASSHPSATADQLLPPARLLVALYRPGWSYRSDQAIAALRRARYVSVAVYHSQRGSEAELGDLVRLRRIGADSMNLDRPFLAYRVVSGAASDMYLLLSPLPSLKVYDDSYRGLPVYAEGVADATAKAEKRAADLGISRENLLFRVEPRWSHVSVEFAEPDRNFWHGNAAKP